MRMVFLCLLVAAGFAAAEEPGASLLVENAPATGLVVQHVDLASLGWTMLGNSPTPPVLRAVLSSDNTSVPAQFVADRDYDGTTHAAGTLVLKVPREGSCQVSLTPEKGPSEAITLDENTARTRFFSMEFAPDRQAGLPSALVFAETGKRFDTVVWNDRLYDKELGQYWLRYDRQAKTRIISKGPLCTVVRFEGRYCNANGEPAPSQADATYDWYLFNDVPLAYVTADVRQQQAHLWDEFHFLELNFPDESFLRWAGGDPRKDGTFTGSTVGAEMGTWGALIDGRNGLGMFGASIRYYDGRGGYGTYLHSTTHNGWRETKDRCSTWLWIGAADQPADAVQKAAQTPPARALLTLPELHQRIAALAESAKTKEGADRNAALWKASLAATAESAGLLDCAKQLASGDLPPGWKTFAAGEFGMAVRQSSDGIHIQSLFDTKAGRELMAAHAGPLFSIALRRTGVGDKGLQPLASNAGWRQVTIEEADGRVTMKWGDPADERFAGVRVTAVALPDLQEHAWRWSLQVENESKEWSLWQVTFPQTSVACAGDDWVALIPQGAGREIRDLWNHPYEFKGTYPSGWSAMQLLAAYDPKAAVGLYSGLHDPLGSTKVIILQSDPASRSLRLAYEHPVPDMGVAGNRFVLSGEGVWRLLRGDWFDAAMIYKAWAKEYAAWWPSLTADGRADTPLWMRELCAWAQTGGGPGDCVEAVKEFARFMDVPAGFHWYNWHEIPFDNDYPHYFPTKGGMQEGVQALQQANVFVMPYINGRLWDTRDKGFEDFEFTKVALPAVAKDEHGKPYTEVYGSKESDGSPVKLGVMCPTTLLWQQTVKDIVLRLQTEVGVKGVYIDQIAAAAPVLCMDKSHGHPLGGGHWWNQGYWKMLEAIRAAKPADCMLTTECNGEPFIRLMDGYLTWHWQEDGQVPVFPAIYGGALQMFGRSYGGGATHDLALRMRAGQQLVFGEQIGWLDPKFIAEKDNAEFFRHCVQVRWHLRRYFYAGEMARPPKLIGDVPAVKADWQWNGEHWVSTPALLTGAWRLPQENKLALFFANVSDAPVTATLKFDGASYGLSASNLHAGVIRQKEGVDEIFDTPAAFDREMTFPAKTVMALELTP